MTFTRRRPSTYFAGAVIAASVSIGIAAGVALTNGITATVNADAVACDLTQYQAKPGLTATADQSGLLVSWTGQNGSETRARYATTLPFSTFMSS